MRAGRSVLRQTVFARSRRHPCQEVTKLDFGNPNMAATVAIFVSKRLQRPAAAMLCLLAAQLMLGLASCHPEPTPMAARVAISH